jgi:uncharacterized protein (TIGR04255 family)
MSESNHYPKAAITEALINIGVVSSAQESIDSSELRDRVSTTFSPNYADCQQILEFQGGFEFANERVSSNTTQRFVGYRLISSDQKYVVQLRFDGFTLSRLAPYDCWQALYDETRKLWELYSSIFVPSAIDSVTVRYINQFDIPLPFQDFKDYLKTFPEVAPEIDTGLNSYFMQLQMFQEDIQGMLTLNQGVLPAQNADFLPILLDINLFCQVAFAETADSIWGTLNKLRDRKNKIFEACITERLRELLS